MGEDRYKDAWWSIANAIGEALTQVEPAQASAVVAQTLVPCLGQDRYKDAWWSIASAIGQALTRVEPAQASVVVAQKLMSCLGQDRYKDVWSSIAHAIGEALARVEPAQASVIVAHTLVPCLGKTRYKDAWWSIASAIDTALTRVEPVQASAIVAHTLAPCLGQTRYKDAWWSIASAIDTALTRVEPEQANVIVAQTLVPCLGQDRYKDAWRYVAFGIGSAVTRVEPAQASVIVAQTLVPCLGQDRYKDVWSSIAHAIGEALARVEPATASAIVFQTLAPCLGETRYEDAWWSTASAIGTAVTRVEPAQASVIVAQTLLPCLGQDRSKDVWWPVANAISKAMPWVERAESLRWTLDSYARAGRASLAIHMVDAVPQWNWFVRKIDGDAQPNLIIYGVCERNSPELLFDPELQCAPPFISSLCNPERGSTEYIKRGEILEMLVEAASGVGDFVKINQATLKRAIDQMSQPKRTRTVRDLMEAFGEMLPLDQQSKFMMDVAADKTENQPINGDEDKATKPSRKAGRGKPAGKAEKLRNKVNKKSKSQASLVNRKLLLEVLKRDEARELIVKRIIGDDAHHQACLQFDEPRYACPDCGMLNPARVSKKRRLGPPDSCEACQSPEVADGRLPQGRPDWIAECPECLRQFLPGPPSKGWLNQIRVFGRDMAPASTRPGKTGDDAAKKSEFGYCPSCSKGTAKRVKLELKSLRVDG